MFQTVAELQNTIQNQKDEQMQWVALHQLWWMSQQRSCSQGKVLVDFKLCATGETDQRDTEMLFANFALWFVGFASGKCLSEAEVSWEDNQFVSSWVEVCTALDLCQITGQWCETKGVWTSAHPFKKWRLQHLTLPRRTEGQQRFRFEGCSKATAKTSLLFLCRLKEQMMQQLNQATSRFEEEKRRLKQQHQSIIMVGILSTFGSHLEKPFVDAPFVRVLSIEGLRFWKEPLSMGRFFCASHFLAVKIVCIISANPTRARIAEEQVQAPGETNCAARTRLGRKGEKRPKRVKEA